jgi:hypothetical protein
VSIRLTIRGADDLALKDLGLGGGGIHDHPVGPVELRSTAMVSLGFTLRACGRPDARVAGRSGGVGEVLEKLDHGRRAFHDGVRGGEERARRLG